MTIPSFNEELASVLPTESIPPCGRYPQEKRQTLRSGEGLSLLAQGSLAPWRAGDREIRVLATSHRFTPHSGATAEPQTLAIPVHAGLHKEAGTHSCSKSKRCPNSECTLRSSVNERSFLIFLFEKKFPTWISKHFQHQT